MPETEAEAVDVRRRGREREARLARGAERGMHVGREREACLRGGGGG